VPVVAIDSVAVGAVLAVLTTLVWATSFPAIKTVVPVVGSYAYTWIRSLIAVSALAPVVVRELRRAPQPLVRYGLAAGAAYALGLWLQGWGTGLTTASKSAFITGLSVVFVHLYAALRRRGYGPADAASLALAVAGLYTLTSPGSGGSLAGDLLVLAGSVAWAAEIVLVSKAAEYAAGRGTLLVTALILSPPTLFIVPDALDADGLVVPPPTMLAVLVYLGLACSVGATLLQVEAQKRISPETASVIYLLEPVFAAILSKLLIGETMTPRAVAGSTLILAAMALSVVSEWRRRT
jgi:drug/metabolite transporter (DMT)-like permease